MEDGPFVVSETIQKHVSNKILTSMKDLLIKLRLIQPYPLWAHRRPLRPRRGYSR